MGRLDLQYTFKTGKSQELKDSLRTSVFLCQGISSWLVENLIDYRSSIGTPQEQENARRLYYSAYMLWKSRKCAEETLQSLVKTARLKKMARGYEVSVHIVDTLESFKNTLFRMKIYPISPALSCPARWMWKCTILPERRS